MIYNRTLNAISINYYKKVCDSCTLYIVLFAVFLVTSTVINTVFIYFYWYFFFKKVQMLITNINENSQTN